MKQTRYDDNVLRNITKEGIVFITPDGGLKLYPNKRFIYKSISQYQDESSFSKSNWWELWLALWTDERRKKK